MSVSIRRLLRLAATLVFAAGAWSAMADSDAAFSAPADAVRLELPDLEVRNQDGRSVRFPSEVIHDRLAVVSFIYTSCTTACPLTAGMLSKLQESLGNRLEREVRIVSITLDPTVDTPARLKEYGQKFHARPGWIWLTGAPPTVKRLLQEMGVYTPDYTAHPPVLLIVDGRRSFGIKLNGFQSPQRILAQIDRLKASK